MTAISNLKSHALRGFFLSPMLCWLLAVHQPSRLKKLGDCHHAKEFNNN